MNKKRIKKILAEVSIAGLIAGVGLTGTAFGAGGSCGKGSCGGKDNTTEKGKASCGKGSCGGKQTDNATGSCGKGSCGKGSCGKAE